MYLGFGQADWNACFECKKYGALQCIVAEGDEPDWTAGHLYCVDQATFNKYGDWKKVPPSAFQHRGGPFTAYPATLPAATASAAGWIIPAVAVVALLLLLK